MRGTLQLFRTQQQLDASGKDAEALAADGIPYEMVDPDGCVRAEPALARVRQKFVGGLLTPNDETGDCFKFTNALSAKCRELGVGFTFDTTITGLDIESGRARGVFLVGQERVDADAVIVALGSYSPLLLRPYGIALPVYPVKGYSLTVPIVDPLRSPESTVMDETYKIAITRLGDRIRVGGMAEISGYNGTLRPARRSTLEHSVTDLFPGGDMGKATFWSGLRPMTPDGTPIIGATNINGLFLNTGHGTVGWTMSTGSARLIAAIVDGREPEIAATQFSLGRYKSS